MSVAEFLASVAIAVVATAFGAVGRALWIRRDRPAQAAGPGRTVHDWSIEELRSWLEEHPPPGMATT